MKKLLLACILFVAMNAQAQVPVQTSIPIVQKATATWCGPCGDWGWGLMEEIMTDNASKAAVISCYGSSSSNYYNAAAGFLVTWNQSWPNWGVNNKQETEFSGSGGIYPTTTRSNVQFAVDSFAATSPVASTGYYYTITGNAVSVITKTKFWQATNGEFYLTAYMIEDSVYGYQNGHTPTTTAYHHNVLRGSVTTSPTGDLIASGSIAVNQTYNKNFNFTITDTSWHKNKMKLIVVLWKKNGSDFDFINANNKNDATLSIATIEAVNGLEIYPNPAQNNITIKGILNQPGDVKVSIVSAIGQMVAENNYRYPGNQFNENISLDKLTSGTYFINITSGEHAKTTQKVIVDK